MAKFYGSIGYAETTETAPGVWTETITEQTCCGDVMRNNRRLEAGESVNDNVTVNNIVSIVSDPCIYKHMFAIRYVRWMGTAWKVTNVEVQSPRLLLTIGGVYNGPTN